MDLEEILSVDPGSEQTCFDYLSVRKNFNNNITVAIGSKYNGIIVFEVFPEDSFSKPVNKKSFSDFREINGLGLSPDASRLYFSGGTNWWASGFLDLTSDSGLSSFNLPKSKAPMGICSYNPVREIVAVSYWNDNNKMNIKFLSFDKDSGTYISSQEKPELPGPLAGYYLIHSLSWSSDGTHLMITTGEVDDGYEGTNGDVEIIRMAGNGNIRQYMYINHFSQTIGASGFNHDNSVAAFSFDDKIRFVDVNEGKVLSTRRKVSAKDICFYKDKDSGKLFYTGYSCLYCMELKKLKDCFSCKFDESIKRLELLPADSSGFSEDLLFILFSSGKFSIMKIK